jgi:hypothetical protein
MQRFLFSALLAAAAFSATACTDETPVLPDDDFPPGSVPITREITVPASAFFENLGSFSGYSDASDAAFVLVASQFDGSLDAHALARFAGFPTAVSYTRNGEAKSDGAFTYASGTLMLDVDTAATSGGAVTVQVWQAAQRWDRNTATWTLAVDTGAVQTPWTEAGGTRGALLAEGTFTNSGTNGDSLVVSLAGTAVTALADSLNPGLVITTSTPGARIQLTNVQLIAGVRPDSAAPDTTINFTVPSVRTFVYTPDQPQPGTGYFAVGGIRGARTLIRIDPDQPVPGCAAGETCADIPLSQVRLNDVSLLLRPGPVPDGFETLEGLPLLLRLVEEPELGAAAPLGIPLLESAGTLGEEDLVVRVRITGLSRGLVLNDTSARTFALVSQVSSTNAPPTFGVAFFEDDPQLRIVYTLPARRRLP